MSDQISFEIRSRSPPERVEIFSTSSLEMHAYPVSTGLCRRRRCCTPVDAACRVTYSGVFRILQRGGGNPSLPSPPLPLPSLSSPSLPFPSLPLPSLPLPLEVGPLLRLGGLGERFSSPSGSGQPGRQTVFGEFQVKNVASSSNDLQELFRK